MRHRVFVAINLDDKTLDSIQNLLKECRKSLPRAIEKQIRFLPRENWHITISFLGYQEEESIERIKFALREVAQKLPAFSVQLEKLIWGPPGSAPRMVWILGTKQSSLEIGKTKTLFEDELDKNAVPFDRETREFNAHVTLARCDLRLPQPRPRIEKDANLPFRAKSIDLMESHLSRDGARYTVLQRFSLHNEQ